MQSEQVTVTSEIEGVMGGSTNQSQSAVTIKLNVHASN